MSSILYKTYCIGHTLKIICYLSEINLTGNSVFLFAKYDHPIEVTFIRPGNHLKIKTQQ